MKRIALLILFCLCVLNIPVSAQLKLQNDMSLNTYNKSGNPDQSYYPDNSARYLYDTNIAVDNRLENGARIISDISLRFTDDILIDDKTIALERFKTSINNNSMKWVFGDIYASFSEYSLRSSLKGMQMDIGRINKNRFSFAAGINTPRWENLWERENNSRTLRYIWGSSYERALKRNGPLLKINYAGAVDDRALAVKNDTPKEIHNGTMEIKAKPYKGIDIKSELGYAYSDEDTSGTGISPKSDNAFKTDAAFRHKNFSGKAVYRRIGPDYKTPGGFISSDLESIDLETSFKVYENNLLRCYYNRDKDNLDGSKSTTINQRNPGASVSLKLPYMLSANTGWDIRTRKANDGSVDNITNTLRLDLSRDFKSVSASVDFQFSALEDRVNDQDSRNTSAIGIDLSGNFTVGRARFSCRLSESYNIEKYEDGSGRDTNMTHRAGITAELPEKLNINSDITISGNDFRENTTDRDRVVYSFSVLKDFSEEISMSLLHEQSENDYAANENDYAEMKTTAKMSYKF